jgi:hypothetical protein
VATAVGRLSPRLPGRVRPAAAPALVALLAVMPLVLLLLLTERTQVPLSSETHRLCRILGPRDVVIIPGLDEDGNALAPAVRSVCRVPVALGDGREDRGFYLGLANDLSGVGRPLVVLSSGRLPYAPSKRNVINVSMDELQRVIGGRPKGNQGRHLAVWLSRF